MSTIKRNFYFILLFVFPLLAEFLRKFELSKSILLFIKSIDELALILALPLAFRGFIRLVRNRYGFWVILFFFLYIMMGILSGIQEYVPLKQMLFQFALEMKYLLVICIMFGIPLGSLNWFVHRFFVFAKLVLLASIPLVVWQFSDPSTYHSFFLAGGDQGKFFLPDGTGLERASGVFWFTGQFALFSGISFIYFLFLYLEKKDKNQMIWIILSFSLLLSTFSRGEIVGTMLGVAFVLFLTLKRIRRILFIAILSCSLLIAYPIIKPFFVDAYHRLGLDAIQYSIAPRTVYYYYSIVIAMKFFPLGSGLGTFGGYASVVFDSDIYRALGFDSFWWYNTKSAMTDTFWPHILGESGILGFLFFLSSLFFLIFISIKGVKNKNNALAISYSAVAAMILISFNSLTAPNFYLLINFSICVLLLNASVSLQRFTLVKYKRKYVYPYNPHWHRSEF